MFRLALLCLLAVPSFAQDVLPGTAPLNREGDLAARMVSGIDAWLMRATEASIARRAELWKPDFTSLDAYHKSVEPNRSRFRRIIGAGDARVAPEGFELIATLHEPATVAQGKTYQVMSVRWPVFENVWGEGLLLMPDKPTAGFVVAVGDADQTPEMVVGLAPGVPEALQFARRMVESGATVLVPAILDRADTFSGNPAIRMTNQTHREFVYRMAYELGRHVIGYDVQTVLAGVDQFKRMSRDAKVGVVGYGEGGLVALYSAAVDTRLDYAVVRGYFQSRQRVWAEPIYRNVWSLLTEFGDAEIALLVHPRPLIVDAVGGPEVASKPPPTGGKLTAAPGAIAPVDAASAAAEWKRFETLAKPIDKAVTGHVFLEGNGAPMGVAIVDAWSKASGVAASRPGDPPADRRKGFDPAQRQKRRFDQLVTHTQKLLRECEKDRAELWKGVDVTNLAKFEPAAAKLREHFHEEAIGKMPAPDKPASPRSRRIYDQPKWVGWELTLDLYEDVFAYGILLLPKDLKPGEKRPVVVCQHGLEGRPQDLCDPTKKNVYFNFAGALADRGFVVFVPQNPYIGRDAFRVLQRKANPLKLSLFSFIIRQHERILEWLSAQPFVDADRIGFYGLSYGGKTAMRVPAVLTKYCLSICSGDFNEWIAKNVSYDYRGSYMFTVEYEMYEFDLGRTYNYAEMAWLICPRPFLVERGHKDGVGIDEWVSHEFARVRRVYAFLGIGDRTDIEYFNGGHQINGKATYDFLHHHLKWPKPQ